MSGSRAVSRRGAAIVTGGSHGIGRAIGGQLRADGYRVVLADIVPPESLAEGMEFRQLDVGDPAAWERIIRVNQTGALNGMRSVIPHLIRRGAGSVVNISSIYGAVGTVFDPAYHASKAALRQMSKHAAVAYGRYGVRVNAVLPGLIDTRLTRGHTGDQNAGVIAQTPMRRSGEPREVAAAVSFLCSEQASFITGIDLPVDGGFLAQ